jgi:hypothetical protein
MAKPGLVIVSALALSAAALATAQGLQSRASVSGR